MTVSELYVVLQSLVDSGCGDQGVYINAITGRLSGRSMVEVAHAGMGIDWDSKKFVLHPRETLFGEALSRKRRRK